jgi:decaprenylphospho-beta-D-erythro-pentofuranosid-2-ulose 2-reductase
VIDATGMPQTAVVLGGTSDLALAVLGRLASSRLRAVVLAGRDLDALSMRADELATLGVKDVFVFRFDALEFDRHDAFAKEAFEQLGSVDLLLVAAGVLGQGGLDLVDAGETARVISANFAGPAGAIIAFTKLMRDAGSGRIVVFSSAAGARVRKANFVYGASKAGLDGFSLGLGDALVGSGVGVTIVRPGFVRTKMTTGMPPAPFAVGPDVVATAVVRALERDDPIVWVPPVLGYLFALLRLLPRSLWRRLPGA